MNLDDDYVPTVVVTAVDIKHKKVELGSDSNQEKRYVLHVADGDENIITVYIGTQLNSRMGTIEVGTILKLYSFRRGFLPREPGNPERMALLVWNIKPCGYMEVKQELQEMPMSRLVVKHPSESGMDDSSDDDSFSEGDVDVDDGSDDEDDDTLTWRNAKCTTSRRLCSKHGIDFDVCVTKAFPVADIDLEEIARDCWFVTKEVSKMANNEKRNVLYWWFMVNVYHVGGANKRKCPPLCLIKAIREAYPNPKGVPYVDFRKQSRKRRR